MFIAQVTLGQYGGLGALTLPPCSKKKNLCITFESSKIWVSAGDWLQLPMPPPWIPQSAGAQVPCVRMVYTVSPQHLQTPNRGLQTVQVFTEKNLSIHGPTQFQPMLFESLLSIKVGERS